MINYFFILLFLILSLNSCSKPKKEILKIKEENQQLEMISAYSEGLDSLNKGDPYFAAKKFLEAEILFPQSDWAPKSALMASYSYYTQNYYAEALSNLDRFLKTYPNHKDIVYAHYLIAMCYYETIEDEKRDKEPIIRAKDKFSYILDNYPNTDFAIDAKFKLNFIEDLLASKEMYLGRHYLKKGKWIASLNRFKFVVENYDQTIFIEEALFRLVEINYRLGLEDESKKYAKILGYNYLSSEWYKQSYKILNNDYSLMIEKSSKKNKEGVIQKFKNLF